MKLAEFNIERPDCSLRQKAIDKIDNLNKPKGSLGRLEELALKLCLVQQTLSPQLKHPCHLLLGGDHGIEREGVSVSPREVTWQQMINFTKGGGGVNMFCRQNGFTLKLVDTGVDYDLSSYPEIKNCKIDFGTRNFLHEPAMTEVQYLEAIETGRELVDECIDEGSNIICIGEMGIANTSPSSVWMSLFENVPLDECIGAGAGLDKNGVNHKKEVLQKSVERFLVDYPEPTAEEIIMYFGGFEMVTAIGAMLRAAQMKITVLIDGFIMTACALAATRLYPQSQDYMIFCHCGDESGHRLMLEKMGEKPLLNLGLRLREGTGALCAYPIIESAVRMINEMNNFKNARITKYF
ncbi:MAG: nicotinate-nucleotide--dimethylbenzimidazole phosphoribosyltransferase [Bacteroidales bacterium]|nr:nicotinate-nucleotide--dimethylbenzimidazole phosphoribosyltransferase [Bacteroidales bacterium]